VTQHPLSSLKSWQNKLEITEIVSKQLQVNVNESSTLESTLLQDMHNGVYVEIHIRPTIIFAVGIAGMP
jgi:hypothetical protein